MMIKSITIQCVLLILLASFSQLTVAKNKSKVSLEQASELIRNQSKGKVLSAKTTNFDGKKMHRIQVLTTSGRVKIYQVPVSRESHKNINKYKNNNSYYKNNLNSSRKMGNPTYKPNYTAPQNHRSVNSSTKGESKQK